jgi:tetratricopeptide (TPR) repeat protein
LDEQGRSEAAIDSLRRALQAAPEYVDAMFNLAVLLQRSNRHKEAAEYRRRYLDYRFRESCHKRGIHLSFQAPICAGALRMKD